MKRCPLRYIKVDDFSLSSGFLLWNGDLIHLRKIFTNDESKVDKLKSSSLLIAINKHRKILKL